MAENKHKGSEFSNVGEVWAQNEKKKSHETGSGKKDSANKETLGDDYWERVADDVASGYKSKEDENSILNIDQEPGDNERDDKVGE